MNACMHDHAWCGLNPGVGVRGNSAIQVRTMVSFVPVLRVLPSSQSFQPLSNIYRVTGVLPFQLISVGKSRLGVVSRINQFKSTLD